MILTKEQIYRYMRHILMPDISGQGQKKILDSSVALFYEDPDKASMALYYLTAAGVGNIYCHFNNTLGWDILYKRLLDLNSDVKITLLSGEAYDKPENQSLTRIVAGNLNFVNSTLQNILKSDAKKKYIPSIICINNGWRGIVRTLGDWIALEGFLSEMVVNNEQICSFDDCNCSDKLSSFLSSLMAVIEHLKLALSLGRPLYQALYYDLSDMEFDLTGNSTDMLCKLLSPNLLDRRFTALANSKALIIGCGGLGSPAAFALASSGIGTIGLVDFDAVEISNLNRQIMHSTSRIGMSKVLSAEIFLKQINPDILLKTYDLKIDKSNVLDIISSYDVIICGLDNSPARYVLNDACYAAKKPLLEAGALDISGLATTIIPDEGHCYRCIFPESIDSNSLPSCSETGVLGPVPGVMGIIQAVEAIKLLTGIGESLKNKILLFDVFDTDIYVADHGKNKYCELCS